MNRVSQPNNHSFSTKRSKCLAALATSIAATSYYGVYKGVTALTKNPDVHTDFKNTTNGTELTNSLPAYQRVAIFFGTTLKNGSHLSYSGNDLHNIFNT